MNTIPIRMNRFALLFLLILPSWVLVAQDVTDTIAPASPTTYSIDIIQGYGRSITMPANEKVRIQAITKNMTDSCIIYMKLRQESSEQFDEMVMEQFKRLFDDQVVNQNVNAIPNFFQPRACLDSTIFPAYYSVQAYCDSASKWLDYIEIYPETEVVAHDFYYKYRRVRYTYTQVGLQFRAPTRFDCDSRIDTTFNLNIWFAMSKQKVSQGGEAVPMQTKIKFLQIAPTATVIDAPPVYKNRWGFLNFGVHAGNSSAAFKPVHDDFNNLSIMPAANYGILASYTLFASDTFSLPDKHRLWEYGLDLGVGYDHLAWNWNLDIYTHTASNQNVSPLNSLICTYNLLTEITDYKAEEAFDILTVPLSLTLKRYFSPKRINSLILKAGVSFNYLLGNSTEITSGTISYTALNCSFQDPQSGAMIEGVTITNLPYYGFGTFDAALISSEMDDIYEPFFLAANVKLGIDLRKNRHSRLHWIITPYFNYAFTDFSASSVHAIEPGGYMTDISAATTSLKPYNFGLEIGLAYNITPNSLKSIRISK